MLWYLQRREKWDWLEDFSKLFPFPGGLTVGCRYWRVTSFFVCIRVFVLTVQLVYTWVDSSSKCEFILGFTHACLKASFRRRNLFNIGSSSRSICEAIQSDVSSNSFKLEFSIWLEPEWSLVWLSPCHSGWARLKSQYAMLDAATRKHVKAGENCILVDEINWSVLDRQKDSCMGTSQTL